MMEKILPFSWSFKKLGEICHTTSGGTPSRKRDEFYNGTIPWVKSGELDKGTIHKTDEYITEQAVQNSSAKIFPAGTLLIALYGATIGKIGFLGVDAATNQAICGIFKSDIIHLNYLAHYLFFSRGKLVEQGAGGAQPNISQTILKDLQVPLPPLAEQHRIVAKIEELFSELDKGIETLKTAQQQLTVYRLAVLKYAFEGRLTNPEAKEGELPEGWESIKISKACNKLQDGSHFSPKIQHLEFAENRYKYITAKNIRPGKIILENITYVDEDFHKSIYTRCNPEYGDVLMTKDGVNTGDVAINSLREEITLLSSVCLFKTNTSMLLPKFLMFFIQSPKGADIIKSSMTGTAIKRVILKKLRDAVIYIPSLKEQKLIVAEIESRLSVCDKIEESIQQGLQQADALRQSILKKAFEGKLVPQDPNDEPASVLLARIRSERGNTILSRNKRSKK